ncbi:asparagine synthase-related protein [Paenibacillus sp. G2S3]|uniref:asparagine synthase-related protein n=1 Tax=Paenibacillus sp. G2S3 TaxID=3047872 RepID=UPI0024C13EB3|nr:asparagine synthetase B family protein [Paenibacillus sp. G2S3]WHY18427.1 asparagine synthase-related protein [Paenibacillus sp. G2S3]
MIIDNNKGFKWFDKNNTITKGYFFYEGIFYKDNDLNDFCAEIEDYETLLDIVKRVNGFFSIVLYRGNETFAVVDRVRSFPIFFTSDGKSISDSVETLKEKYNISTDDADETVLCEIISCGYSQNNDTVFNMILQLAAGQILRVNLNNIHLEYYYKHTHKYVDYKFEDVIEKISNISSNLFDRLIESLEGKTVILPLSGGYDSRYIAAMLKKKGYEKVICYTYGQIGSYEVETSKSVAEILGFEWHYIEYDEKVWDQLLDKDCISYGEYSHNYCTIPHFQDYPAIKKLIEMDKIPQNSVVVTGFCGDLPAGSFVLAKEDENGLQYEMDWLVNYIFNEHYKFVKIPEFKVNDIKKKIKKFLVDMNEELKDFESFTSLYEAWFTNSRPIRWVVNSNRLYEINGMEWRMPLWDNEFVDLFYSLRTEFRRNSFIYEKFLFNKLFIPLGIDFKKPSFVNSKPKIKYKSFKQRTRRFVYILLVRIAFITGWSSWNYFDVNNYSKAAFLLHKQIKNKRLLDYKTINFHQMNAIWWSEKKYGSVKLRRILYGNK